MTSKDELWANFVETMAHSLQLQLRAKKARDDHAEGGSYCPYSDTPDGIELAHDISRANKAAQNALDSYLQQSLHSERHS